MARPHSTHLRTAFPAANRGATVRKMHLKGFLSKQAELGTPFSEVAADFQFLLHAATLLPASKLEALCKAVAQSGRDHTGAKAKATAQAAFDAAERLLREKAGLV